MQCKRNGMSLAFQGGADRRNHGNHGIYVLLIYHSDIAKAESKRHPPSQKHGCAKMKEAAKKCRKSLSDQEIPTSTAWIAIQKQKWGGYPWEGQLRRPHDPGEAKSSHPASCQNRMILRINGALVKDRAWHWTMLSVFCRVREG